jgi:hypothetical protein
MSSTYSTNLALELIGTGDQAGSWGNTTNTNLGTLIEQAISGYVTQAVSTGTDTTITIPNGATGVARNMYIELTGTGGASTNLIVPTNKKLYFIFNNTSSGQVTVKVSGQTGVSVPNKAKMILVSNGTDIVDATNYIGNISAASANITVLTSASATITNLIATSASITTLTNNPTFGAGTANGVLYLNGSKVATSGSALTFDGTDFKMPNGGSMLLGASASGASLLLINGTAAAQRLVLGTSGTDAVINATRTSGTSPNLLFQLEGANSMALTSTGLGIGTASPGAKLHVLGSNFVGIFAGTNANTVYTEYRYNSTTTSGLIGNGSSILSAAADSDFIVRSEGALKFATNGNNFRAVIDTSGNLGLGVTPGIWTVGSAFQLGYAGSVWYDSTSALGNTRISNNIRFNSALQYLQTGAASYYQQGAGAHYWFSYASGSAGAALSGGAGQAMTLDASGNLLVGTTSASGILAASGRGYIEVNGTTDSAVGFKSNGTLGGYLYNSATEFRVSNYSNNPLTFHTNNTERARITSGGFFKASNTGTYSSSTNDRYEFTSDKNDLTILVNSTNTGANVNNVYSQLPAGANAGAYHFVGSISGSGLQFTVDADGDVKNTNNSYGSISDIKLKQDVVDAASQWDDIKALRVRKYRFKRNPDAALQIGLVAQEAEAVSPGLVEETADRDEEGNDLGTTTKSVKYSVLYMKAVKALQEAMARIEQLEAKVAALESK